MADRLSTLRYKAEGTQEVASKSKELNRQLIQQQRQLAQSYRDAKASGDDPALKKRAQQDAAQLVRTQRLIQVEQKAQFSREVVATRDLNTAKAAADEKATKKIYKARAKEDMQFRDFIAKRDRDDDKAFQRFLKDEKGDGSNSIGRLGGKFVIGRAIGSGYGSVTGDSKGGQMIGTAAEAFLLTGSAVTGGLVAAGLLASEYFSNVRENADKARVAALSYRDAMFSIVQQAKQLSLANDTNSSFGVAMGKQGDALAAAAIKIKDAQNQFRIEHTNTRDPIGNLLNYAEGRAPMRWFNGETPSTTGRAQMLQSWENERALNRNTAASSRVSEDESRQRAMTTSAAESSEKIAMLRVQEMPNGYIKERAVLEMNLANQRSSMTRAHAKEAADQTTDERQAVQKTAMLKQQWLAADAEGQTELADSLKAQWAEAQTQQEQTFRSRDAMDARQKQQIEERAVAEESERIQMERKQQLEARMLMMRAMGSDKYSSGQVDFKALHVGDNPIFGSSSQMRGYAGSMGSAAYSSGQVGFQPLHVGDQAIGGPMKMGDTLHADMTAVLGVLQQIAHNRGLQ